jgi:hypothetical protein
MNRAEKRKAITKIAKQAIKTGSIDVPMGMGEAVAKRISTLQGGNIMRSQDIYAEVTQTLDVAKVKKRVERKIYFKRLWSRIKKSFMRMFIKQKD